VRQIKTFNQFYSENETNLQRNQRRQGNNEVNGTESRTVKRMSSESRTLKRKRSTKSQWNERNHRAVESQSEGSCSWNHPAEKCSQMYDLLNHEENELLTKSSSCWIKKRRDLLNHEWNKRNHGEKGSVESRMEYDIHEEKVYDIHDHEEVLFNLFIEKWKTKWVWKVKGKVRV
jgi:hypothetical protein